MTNSAKTDERLAAALEARFRELALLQKRIVADEATLNRLRLRNTATTAQVENLRRQLSQEINARKQAELRLNRLEQSTLWRISAPLRQFITFARRR